MFLFVIEYRLEVLTMQLKTRHNQLSDSREKTIRLAPTKNEKLTSSN